MATTLEALNLKFTAKADELKKAQKTLKEARGELKNYSAEQTRSALAASKLEKALSKEQKAIVKQVETTVKAAKATRDLKQEQERLEQQIRETSGSVVDYNDRFAETSRSVALAGDVQSNLGALRGLAGYAGMGGAGEALGVSGEMVALVEELPRLKMSLAGMPATISSAVTALGPAGMVAGVGLVAAIAGLALVSSQAAAEAEKYKQAIASRLAAERELAENIAAGMTSEQAREHIAELRQTIETNQQLLVDAEETLYEERLAAFEKHGGAGAMWGEHFAGTMNTVFDAIELAEKNISDAEAKLLDYNDALAAGAFAANDSAASTAEAAEAERELAAQREASIAQMQQLAERAAEIAAQSAERMQQIMADRALADERAEEDAALRRQFELEDFNARLLDIQKRGQENIIKTRADAIEQERAKTAKLFESVAKIATDLRSKELDIDLKYHKAAAKAHEEYTKRRLRAEEDAQDALFDAEQANNVIQFLQAQRTAEKERTRESQDHSDAASERQQQREEDLQAARQAAIEKRAEYIKQHQEEMEAMKIATAERIAETQAGIAAQTAAEEAARAKRMEREKIWEDIRTQRQEQDRQIQDERQAEATRRQIARIQDEINAINVATGAVKQLSTATSRLAALAAQLAARARSATSTGSSTRDLFRGVRESVDIMRGGGMTNARVDAINEQLRAGRSSHRITAFANEGVVTRPTVAMLGERLKTGQAEAVVKFKMSEGIPARFTQQSGSRKPVTVVYNPVFSPMVGDIATGAEVSEALQQYSDAHMSELNRIFNTVIYDPARN